MTAIENLIDRRSIRKYKNQQINDEDLNLILKAGTMAPTAKNLQTPIIVAVQNKADITEMSRLNAKVLNKDIDPFYGAPTVLVVLADAEAKFAVQDGSLVMGNLMNAASALGLGSCWINRAREVFDMPEGKALLKKWGVEGNYIGIGNCILGYSDEKPEPKPRKENYVIIVK